MLIQAPRKLTLITAPAGFGKTSFAAQRYLELRRGGATVIWISVGVEEQESYRFLSLLIEATGRLLPGVGDYALKLLESTPDVAVGRLVTSYINDLVESGREITMFLDDYQLAESRENNEALELLLRQSPDSFRIVLTSRISPAISLAALRVSNLVTDITQEELRFSDQEAQEFFELSEERYRRQVALYVQGIADATSANARGHLLRL